ncbi:DUF4180 domain-containing protein [Paenibacillus ihbetae]|uniref:Cytoplasmic protein n=1 Tax=Paenibacillus ihbetae TaxID=1870820 RepID=A0A1B2DUK0_9BACL|nr:DUF4180 domain-containing protein [Paenibacillus ihbetae]ANY71393.1 cytoplasmic protein [Paenibacillus ihbetae]OOC61247.1 cytoplasmic protein [Paenibacillus ihbetae]
MKITKHEAGSRDIAVVTGTDVIIDDVQSALDLMATVQYETGSDRIVIHKSLISERFFDLSTRLAGDILQKFMNYRAKLAIVGDFSVYSSRSLRDFIYESNNGSDVFFMPTEEQAIEKLSSIK